MISAAVLEEIRRRSIEIGHLIADDRPDVIIATLARVVGTLAVTLDRLGWKRADDVIAMLVRGARAQVDDVNDGFRSKGEA
jgi:hypothetical protein